MVLIRSDGAGSKDELRTPFVEQRTYRRRRLMDVARIAPIIGALLFLVPILWPGGGDITASVAPQAASTQRDVAQGIETSTALVYLVSVWLGLILFSAAFSIAVRRWAVHWTGRDGADGHLSAGGGGPEESASERQSNDIKQVAPGPDT